MNVLVIAPHPDDEIIGCGGTLCAHVSQGDLVTVVFLTSGELGLKHLPPKEAWSVREREARSAAQLLKLSIVGFLRCRDWYLGEEITRTADLVRPILRQVQPELIYLPQPQDDHPDHQACLPICKAALKGQPAPRPALRLYETWTPLSRFDVVQDISAFMKRKVRAVKLYGSQLAEFNYEQGVVGLNQYRGAMAAKRSFAEVFAEIHL